MELKPFINRFNELNTSNDTNNKQRTTPSIINNNNNNSNIKSTTPLSFINSHSAIKLTDK